MGPWSDPWRGSKTGRAGILLAAQQGKNVRYTPSIPANPGRPISRHAHDDGREGLLGTPAAAHGLGALALAAGYYATAQLGEALGFPNAPVSALWLPNALVMGALLIAPRRYWWFYLLAILPAHLIAQLPLPDVALLRVLTQYVLNCATALIGAFALAHFEPGTHRFDRVLPAWRLVFFGGLVAPFTTSVLMAAVFLTTDIDRSFWMTTVARALTNTFRHPHAWCPLMVHIADRPDRTAPARRSRPPGRRNVLAICLVGRQPRGAARSAIRGGGCRRDVVPAAAHAAVGGSPIRRGRELRRGVALRRLRSLRRVGGRRSIHRAGRRAQRPVGGAVPGRHLHTAAAARRRTRRTPLARKRARRQRCAARRGTGVDPGPDRDSRQLRPHRRCQRIMAPARRAHPRRALRQPQGRRKSPAPLHRTGLAGRRPCHAPRPLRQRSDRRPVRLHHRIEYAAHGPRRHHLVRSLRRTPASSGRRRGTGVDRRHLSQAGRRPRNARSSSSSCTSAAPPCSANCRARSRTS